ncbi:ribonucleoprotein LSM domain-containing protein [Mrakia frigida]|uniref:ribonucleoprotein LSM domain-containing protein n=1 Tax=Mrakia frigida TaxID=29902 RepID=UPI003FCC0DA6
MSRVSSPELKKFMDKRILIHVQGGRKVTGVLRGFDIFLNLVVDDASDESTAGDKKSIGMVVIRGNSVTSVSTLSA